MGYCIKDYRTGEVLDIYNSIEDAYKHLGDFVQLHGVCVVDEYWGE